jgi:hypothetical protein
LAAPLRAQDGAVSAATAADLPPVAITLDRAVSELVREARAGWDIDRTWPREKADFADEQDLTMPGEVVVEALGRKLHNHPAVDAYIKWQLLSFDPNLSQLDQRQLRRVLRALPPIAAQPTPVVEAPSRRHPRGRAFIAFGQQQAFVGDLAPFVGGNIIAYDPEVRVLTTGTVLDVEGVVSADNRYVMMNIRTVSSQLVDLREFVVHANRGPIGFRNELATRLPHGAARVALRLQTARDLIVAGDPGHAAAVKAVVADARAVSRSDNLTPAARRALLNELNAVAELATAPVRQIKVEADSEQFEVIRDKVRFDADSYADARLALTPPAGR